MVDWGELVWVVYGFLIGWAWIAFCIVILWISRKVRGK